MYGTITFNSAEGVLAAAELQLALLDPERDGISEARRVNALLSAVAAARPQFREKNLLDAFQTAFNTVRANCGTREELNQYRDKLSGICGALFDGLDYVEFEFLWRIQEDFSVVGKEDGKGVAAEDRLFAAAGECEGEHPILAYLVRRELLNAIMSKPYFTDRLERVGLLARELQAAPAELVQAAEETGCNLFFFGVSRRRV